MTAAILQHKRCRSCQGDLEEILNLGSLKLNDFPKFQWEVDQMPTVPLILTCCLQCGLVQLDRTVPADWLYRQYWYRSEVNETMVAELADVVLHATSAHGGTIRRVVDIGANDGTLLMHWRPDIHRIAVEPAMNLRDTLSARASEVWPNYFPDAALIQEHESQVDVVTAIACAYDLEDPNAFFRGIRQLLKPDGLAVIQFQDLGQQIGATAFDNICHEHLEYYTLWSVSALAERAGLRVVDCDLRAINGGSLRVLLRHRSLVGLPSQQVGLQLGYEAQLGLDPVNLRHSRAPLNGFARRVQQAKAHIQETVQAVHDSTQVLDVYGASTKGNILLQVLGIGPAVARYAIDRSEAKHGHYTITGIPIVGEEVAREDPAGVWLVPIWQFRSSVLAREGGYLAGGGTLIFPLPSVEIVRQEAGR